MPPIFLLLLVVSPASEPVPLRDVVVPSVLLRPMHDIDVPAMETGPLVDFAAAEGRAVKAGEVLAKIDSSDAQSALAEAKADYEVAVVEAENDLAVKSAEADLTVATRELQRAEQAHKLPSGRITESKFDALRLKQSQAKLAVQQARSSQRKAGRVAAAKLERVSRAQARLKRHAVKSPVAGSVVESKFEIGEWVEAGQVVARVIQTSQLKVEGMLPADATTEVLVGSPVLVTVPIGKREVVLRGEVTFVSTEAVPASGGVRFRAVVSNPKQLVRPGTKGASMKVLPRLAAMKRRTIR